MVKLTLKRRAILKTLASISDVEGCAITAREISEKCGEGRRASDWAHGALSDMFRIGLVRTVGIAFDNAKTWRITDAGRSALGGET